MLGSSYARSRLARDASGELLKEIDRKLEALASLADQGYDPDFGARPLRRIIQQKVEDKLSDLVLAGEFADGASILVDVGVDGEITLERNGEKAEAPAV